MSKNFDVTFFRRRQNWWLKVSPLPRVILRLCRQPAKDDPTYYCIRYVHEGGRHRYGVVIEGAYK